ncbi:hypothetical protein GCM10011369_17770 [Neiella marina]|uniref:Lipoprotein n=1 Tax=Neiella marina TaxID=508461 RepID=A0A8J2U4Y4_9GAMM|nr:hypothetical protein [Neiella marina]GGA76338.1 hypothetical protein GCM10011369_17770 [Neiella marina]
MMTKYLFIGLALAISGCANVSSGPSLVAYHDDSAWVVDEATQCKVNRYYVGNAQMVSWSGRCIDGFAIGEGILVWVDESGSKGVHSTCLQPDHFMSACKMGSSI